MRSLAIALLLAISSTSAYTAEDKEAALKAAIDERGFPRLEAFNRMTPKMLTTVMNMYTSMLGPDAFEYFDAAQIEVIFAAVSATNNCEMCLSFHAMMLAGAEKPAEDVREIVAGGAPKDAEMRKLVIAAKYAMAHKGILLPREKLHLASMGIEGEKYKELNFIVGQMSAFNQVYIHLISEGLELEPMLQQAGPFVGTVYPVQKDEV